MQDLNDKATGQPLSAAEWNQMPAELQNVIEGVGLTLSGVDLNQLGQAIADYVAKSTFFTSSGPANAYVLTPIAGFQGPTSLVDGMIVRFVPNVDGSGGAVTVNVNGLGAVSVTNEDGSLTSSAREFNTGFMNTLRYDSGTGTFLNLRIPNAGVGTNDFGLTRIASQAEVNAGTETFNYVTPETLAGRTATTTRAGVVELATQTETNTGTDQTRAVTPDTLDGRTATETRTGIVELATISEVQAGADTEKAITPFTLNNNTAQEDRRGVIELATQAEVDAGTRTDLAVTPATLQGKIDGTPGVFTPLSPVVTTTHAFASSGVWTSVTISATYASTWVMLTFDAPGDTADGGVHYRNDGDTHGPVDEYRAAITAPGNIGTKLTVPVLLDSSGAVELYSSNLATYRMTIKGFWS